jgi:hypothetical protein
VVGGLGVPSELEGLPGFERRYAARRFAYWSDRFAAAEPGQEPDNRLRSLNLTFINLAQRWMAISSPFALVAGAVWSFRDSVAQVVIALVLSVATLVPLGMLARRWRQAKQFRTGVVRPPSR